MSVLSLTDVTLVRAERCLLDRVSWSMQAGETVGLVGASGAGKSTLLRIALGLERPDQGRVRWGQVDPYALRGAPLRDARRQLGVVFQQPLASLDPRQTLGASLAEPLRTHEPTRTRPQIERDVEAALHSVGLPRSYAQRLPREVSGGEAQRVAIARALIAKPSVILLDEPTSALDASAAAALINLLLALMEHHRVALLLISHDLAAVGMLARRLVVLDQGRIVESGETDRLLAEPTSPALQSLLAARGGEGSLSL